VRLLNVGCGSHHHPAWTNLDVDSHSPEIQAHDVRHSLPFAADTFDAVYHSHVVEHLHPDEARRFMSECLRVLKPGARLRVVTPDLETIARVYLRTLAAALDGAPGAAADHRWMQIELLDQMVRDHSGGAMERYLKQADLPNQDFVVARIGRQAVRAGKAPGERPGPRRRLVSARAIARRLSRARRELGVLIAGWVAGGDGRRALREGLFRNSGEVHRWLYDRLSLAAVLEQSGFVNVTQCAADESGIPGFAGYGLDLADGAVRKPDSLFMEAEKPTPGCSRPPAR
jgi:predicted SAM-dependent methyltransferase